MTHRYLYADKAAVGPERDTHRWGLFTAADELTEEQAAQRYAADPPQRDRWFGIVRIADGADRPDSVLQMNPRANGVELQKLDEFGRLATVYVWGAYDMGPKAPTRDPDATRVFCSKIVWYSYPPDQRRFLRRNESVGLVRMTFQPDGIGTEEVVTKHGGGQPDEVELQEFSGVDVSANWFDIPEFGDWEAFFEPEGDDEG